MYSEDTYMHDACTQLLASGYQVCAQSTVQCSVGFPLNGATTPLYRDRIYLLTYCFRDRGSHRDPSRGCTPSDPFTDSLTAVR